LRLGGWCDLYVPSSVEVLPSPGQTLICSETVIGRFGSAAADLFEADEAADAPAPPAEDETPEPEPVEAELVIDEEDELTLEELAGDDAGSETDEDEDVSEMFARLRKEAKKIQDDE
jgi:phosphatidylserine decarboxylase